MTERQQLIAALLKKGCAMAEIRKTVGCGAKCVFIVKQILESGAPAKMTGGRKYATDYEMAEMREARHGMVVSRAFDAMRRGAL